MTTVGTEKLWGANEIAKACGLSADFIRTLADRDDTPIYRPPGTGKVFAFRSELMLWLKTKGKRSQL